MIREFLLSVKKIYRLLRILDFNWRSEAPLLLASACGMGLEVLARLLEPWPLKYIFDELISPSREDFKPLFSASHLETSHLLAIAAATGIGIACLRGFAQYWSAISLAIVGNRLLVGLRSRTFDHLQRLSLRFHDQARTGDLVTRLVGDMGRLQEVSVTALLPMIVHLITLVAMIIFLLAMNPGLGLYALIVFPIFFTFMLRIGKRIRSVAREQRRGEGRLGASSAEAMASIRTVQMMGLEGAMANAFSRQNQKNAKQSVKGKRLAARLERGVDILIATVTAVVLWRGANMVISNQLSPGDLLIFLAYMKNAFKPMKDMAKYSGRISGAIASAERIADILATQPEISSLSSARTLPKVIDYVEFSNVSFGYVNHALALNDISFRARQGQLIALVGPSGAGKSTLINLLCRLYDPSIGQVLINGIDIRQFQVNSLRQLISVVPQENILFNISIKDNIAIGSGCESMEEIVCASKIASAHEFIDKLPNGYETIIAERGATLSGGQQRRIAIARAALRHAPILILDEPLSGLDAQNRSMVNAAIQEIKKNRITFAIIHDLAAARDADMIIYMNNGAIVERGSHNELVGSNGYYSRMIAQS